MKTILLSIVVAALGVQVSGAEVKITKPGSYKLGENLTIKVVSEKDCTLSNPARQAPRDAGVGKAIP